MLRVRHPPYWSEWAIVYWFLLKIQVLSCKKIELCYTVSVLFVILFTTISMDITIWEDNANQRFDRFLRKYCKLYPEVKLSDIYSWIRKGQALVNGKKAKEDTRIHRGDVVSFADEALGTKDPSVLISPKNKKMKKLTLAEVQPRILYEDDRWLVFNKPPGVILHPSNNHRNDLCMNDYLEWYMTHTKQYTKEQKASGFIPSFGYRLDKDTSGVLIAAKTYESLQYINEIIRERAIEKYYLTLVVGKVPNHIVIDANLEKSFNKQFDRAQMKVTEKWGLTAKTECWNEEYFIHPELWPLSLLKVKIETWRMHQIRAHLASRNHPILWDIIYGHPVVNRKLYKELKINRQLLHCWKYEFVDINGKTMSFEAPIPADFAKIF